MPEFEYKVVPAPVKGVKGKGLRTSSARFANALSILMNKMGSEGWEYQRAETLPCEERSGIAGKSTAYLNVLVFRKQIDDNDGFDVSTPVLAIEKQDEEESETDTPDDEPETDTDDSEDVSDDETSDESDGETSK